MVTIIRVLYKGKPASVWEISQTSERPDWVKDALAKNQIYWLDNRVRILMAALRPPIIKKINFTANDTDAGFGVYAYGYTGDFLDATNQRVVSRRRFLKEYEVLE
ncbi:hypothetical protein F9B82_02840 [Lacticaseibacillus casei]|jgi:hypothetical protein|uniref:Uncharacterized protein n=2 Tax=Lacticaseibacillus TaxID=2759736 RepID=A0AAN1KF23_LACCA|nr:hypothetical protein BGL52_11730 [Lacticaseibacillus casei]KAB1971437.1 hypothetical protein F9B82_02840 [Lacticaseibacillus casei]TLF41725.1 hypothetical protein FEI15_00495 [Lacticaseibacillus zeae]